MFQNKRGFTLIELVVAIAISAILGTVIYFAFQTALDTWSYTKDELALQKVLSDTAKRIASGAHESYALRHSLEVLEGGPQKILFVAPWSDDAHRVSGTDFVYALNRRIKPGTAEPIGEVRAPESDEWQAISLDTVETEWESGSRVQLNVPVPQGSELRFTYHPDPKKSPDVVSTIWWDQEAQQVYMRDHKDITNLSENPFGIKIIDFKLEYYDRTNKVISENGTMPNEKLESIAGIEIQLRAQMGETVKTLVDFVSLRNSPAHSGQYTLRKGMEIPVPNSQEIHTLLLTNIFGVKGGDEIELELVPKQGKRWKLRVVFENIGNRGAIIQKYSIEYPPSATVHTGYPRTPASSGLDLLTLGPNGIYDYDDDGEIDDTVLLEGEVVMHVNKKDPVGAAIFVKP